MSACRSILKAYSYESPLYKAINDANTYHDEKAIQTLGPYARLLWKVICVPLRENINSQGAVIGKEKLKKTLKMKGEKVETTWCLIPVEGTFCG